MHYRHALFHIDTQTRTVSDENGKLLVFSDKLFTALLFLVEHGQATVDELGDAVNGGESDRLYSHNAIRQYRYQINKLVSHEVIVYDKKQQCFSLVGSIVSGDDALALTPVIDVASVTSSTSETPNQSHPTNEFEADARRYREARALRAA